MMQTAFDLLWLVAQLAALWVVACVLSDHIVTPIMQRRKNAKTKERPGT